MKIDFIFYSDDSDIGVVCTEKLVVPIIALLRKYPDRINSEILKDLESRCRYLLNNKKMTDYFIEKYVVGDTIEESDYCLIAKPLMVLYPQKKDLFSYICGDDNFEELAKCSDTDFVSWLLFFMVDDDNAEKFKIPGEQIFLVAKELAERGDSAGFIYIASVYYERGDKALAFKYFYEAEKLGINSKEFIKILDGINI